MRIGRFRAEGQARTGVFSDDEVVDVSDQIGAYREVLSDPSAIDPAAGDRFALTEIEYLPPISPENTVFCAALNYEAHAVESEKAVPAWPLVFLKLPRTLIGHEQQISFHRDVTDEIDYEAELAAVIGEPARHVTADEALDYVAGYTVLNDTSARDLQLGLQVGDDSLIDWFSGKAMEATTPVGPHVVIDEVDDPQDLHITSTVNGETMQDDSTGMMVNSVADLVAFVSSRVRLTPGDIIATGTPEGVGAFQDIRLHPGDVVEIEIEDVGRLRNEVHAVDK